MHQYKFVFTSDKSREHQGFADFPEGVVPVVPQIGDWVHCFANNHENMYGIVIERSFRYEYSDARDENIVVLTFVSLKLNETERTNG